jgi:hypothetical protein
MTLLAGAAAPAPPSPATAAAESNSVVSDDITPGHSATLLVSLLDVDGLWLRAAAAEKECAPNGGLVLGFFRYEDVGRVSRTIERLILPTSNVRAGLYVRSAVPYRTRVLLDGELTTRLVLGQRASVRVYGETPRGVEMPPWQVVVKIGRV